jgi:hypothetical protein
VGNTDKERQTVVVHVPVHLLLIVCCFEEFCWFVQLLDPAKCVELQDLSVRCSICLYFF